MKMPLEFSLKMWITCPVVCLVLLAACASYPENSANSFLGQPVGVDADPDSLLRTVAELARVGVDALCDRAYVEQKLHVRIVRPRENVSPETHSVVAELEPLSPNTKISDSSYWQFENKSEKSCSVSINFKTPLLCDVASSRVASLLAARTDFSAPYPHRSTQAVFYEFQPMTGDSSSISLGDTEAKCAYGVSVGVKKIKYQ